jgi:lactoylglutathione lyase
VRLAKQHLDIGLFTNDIAAQRAFWADTVGLRLDHELEMAPGWVQHRFDAHGSVIKVNHRTEPLPDLPPSGYSALSIAAASGGSDWTGRHPGGDRVDLVASGSGGVVGIGITVASPDPGRLLEFYRTALEFEQVEPDVLRCGDSIFRIVEGPGGSDVEDFAAPGFRYTTVQVYDADREMDAIVSRGGRVVREPVNFAGIARYGFVSDPDGNWIEVSARTSLTGIAVS